MGQSYSEHYETVLPYCEIIYRQDLFETKEMECIFALTVLLICYV